MCERCKELEETIERLREAIKILNALRRNDQKLTEKAEAEVKRLRCHQDSGPITERDYLIALEQNVEKIEILNKKFEKGLREIGDNLDTPIAIAKIARRLIAEKK